MFFCGDAEKEAMTMRDNAGERSAMTRCNDLRDEGRRNSHHLSDLRRV